MAKNYSIITISESHYCPDCEEEMEHNGTTKHPRWFCNNPDCELISCKFHLYKGFPYDVKRASIAYSNNNLASRPRLHYTTTVLHYINTIQSEDEE